MQFPSLAALRRLHDDLIARTGGATGILAPGALQSARHRCMHGPFHGGGTLTERAAYLLRGIAQDHPFVDGNKRTAFDGAAMFLEQNGQAINADADAVVSFMLDVAQGHHTVPSIQAWIDRHAKPLLGEETEEGA